MNDWEVLKPEPPWVFYDELVPRSVKTFLKHYEAPGPAGDPAFTVPHWEGSMYLEGLMPLLSPWIFHISIQKEGETHTGTPLP